MSKINDGINSSNQFVPRDSSDTAAVNDTATDTGTVEDGASDVCAPNANITWQDTNGDGFINAGDSLQEENGDQILDFKLETSAKPGILRLMSVPEDGSVPFFEKNVSVENLESLIAEIPEEEKIPEPPAMTSQIAGQFIWEDNGDGEVGARDYIIETSGRFYLAPTEDPSLVHVQLATPGSLVPIVGGYDIPVADIATVVLTSVAEEENECKE